MCIDFEKVYKSYDFKIVKYSIIDLNIEYWEEFGEMVKDSVNE